MKYCYKYYFRYVFLVIIFITTFHLLMTVSVQNPVTFIATILDFVVCLVLPVWIVGVITSLHCDIHGVILSVYYDNPFNQGETSVQEW